MKREDLIRSKEFWLIQMQNHVFNLINSFKTEKQINQTQIAVKLGVTKGYVSQILNGEFDHKVSKLVDLALAFNKAPILNFIDIEEYIKDDMEGKNSISNPLPINLFISLNSNSILKVDEKHVGLFSHKLNRKFNDSNTIEISGHVNTVDSFYSLHY